MPVYFAGLQGNIDGVPWPQIAAGMMIFVAPIVLFTVLVRRHLLRGSDLWDDQAVARGNRLVVGLDRVGPRRARHGARAVCRAVLARGTSCDGRSWLTLVATVLHVYTSSSATGRPA